MNVPAQQNQAFQLPAHLQGFQSKNLSKTIAGNIGTAAPPFISIQGNKFTLIDAAGNEQPVGAYDPSIGVYLDCVIFDVHDHLSKVYYAKPYEPGSSLPPDCWSDNGVGPSRQASLPQAPLCGTCPKAEWGSKTSNITGKGIKACSDQQKVAVYVPGFQTFFLLRIPPNSLKNFGKYGNMFEGQPFNMDVGVTRISFEAQGVGTLLFNMVNWIDAATIQVIQEARARNATDALVGRTDVARDPSIPLLAPPATQGNAETLAVATATPPQQFQPAPPPQGFPPQAQAPAAAPPPQQTYPAPLVAPAAEPPKRRRGRPAAETQPQAPAAPAQAPFPHPGQQVTAPAGAPAQNFGMAQPTPVGADPGIMAALQTAFPK